MGSRYALMYINLAYQTIFQFIYIVPYLYIEQVIVHQSRGQNYM